MKWQLSALIRQNGNSHQVNLIPKPADMKYMEALNYLNYRLLHIRPPCTLKYTTFTRARKRSLSGL